MNMNSYLDIKASEFFPQIQGPPSITPLRHWQQTHSCFLDSRESHVLSSQRTQALSAPLRLEHCPAKACLCYPQCLANCRHAGTLEEWMSSDNGAGASVPTFESPSKRIFFLNSLEITVEPRVTIHYFGINEWLTYSDLEVGSKVSWSSIKCRLYGLPALFGLWNHYTLPFLLYDTVSVTLL